MKTNFKTALKISAYALAISCLFSPVYAETAQVQLLEDGLLVVMPDRNLILFGAVVFREGNDFISVNIGDVDEAVGGTGSPIGGNTYEDSRTYGTGTLNYEKVWGSADILLHCQSADIVVYQYINNQEVELLATTIPTNRC